MKLTKIVLIILIVVEQSRNGHSLFSNPWKKLRNKASSMYKSTFGKDTTWHFLGHDQSIYPGNNVKLVEMNKQKWEEHYKCLKRQAESLGKHSSISPEAVLGFEGNNVR